MQQYSASTLAIFEIRSDHTSSVCLLSPSFGHQDGFFTVTSTLPKVMVGLSNPSFNLTTPRPRFPSTAINFPTDLPAPFFRPCSTSSAGLTNERSKRSNTQMLKRSTFRSSLTQHQRENSLPDNPSMMSSSC